MVSSMMKTLFLSPPTYDGYDGGAGSRYQCKREVKSFWYPTWLAQPAALVEGSKLIDAPPHRLRFADVAPEANKRDLIVLHTSTPSFSSDIKTVRALKDLNPKLKIGMVGAKVAVDPTGSLQACEWQRAVPLLLPHLLEEGDGTAAPLRHPEAGEFFLPDVHPRQRIQRDHGDLARQDVLILIKSWARFP